ncbi:MAG: Pvc16 family protein, partial [Gemmatimonadaceae bacterium]
MAMHRGIASACEAIAGLLRGAFLEAPFREAGLRFETRIGQAHDVPPAFGITLAIYRVTEVGGGRSAPPVLGAPGPAPSIALSVGVLITAHAPTAITQYELIGRTLQMLAAHPVLNAEELNAD